MSDYTVYEPTDPVPTATPAGLRKAESMDERIRRIIEHSASIAAAQSGLESFDEADDFDIPDDPVDALTPWEADFDLASVSAIDGGVVARPQVDPDGRASKARSVLSVFKDFIKHKTGDNRASEFRQFYEERIKPPSKPLEPPTEA